MKHKYMMTKIKPLFFRSLKVIKAIINAYKSSIARFATRRAGVSTTLKLDSVSSRQHRLG